MTLFTIDKITEKAAPRPAAHHHHARRFQPYHPYPTVSDAAPVGYPAYLGKLAHSSPLPVTGPSGQRRDECLNSTGGSPSVSPGGYSAVSSSEAGSPEPEKAPSKVTDKNNNKKSDTDEHKKPPHSYISLIAMAILASPEKRLLLCDIYQYIQENYPYYRNNDRSWRNSIRHNLSLNECFIKYGRSGDGRGNFWAVHPANVEDFSRGDFHRRRARRRVRASDMMLHGYSVYHPYAAPSTPAHAYPVPVAATPLGFVPMTVTTLPPYPVSTAVYPPSSYPAAGYPVPTLNPLPPMTSTSTSPVSTRRSSPLNLAIPGKSSPIFTTSYEHAPVSLPSSYPSTQPSYVYPPSTTQSPFHYSPPTSRDSPLARYPPTTLGLAPAPGYGYPAVSQSVITSSLGSYQTESAIPRFLH
ncbi:forkhead box protein B1-like [Patiria miniata]|uniref:Fork-head domain-containing protein n=1 Tax=Patiria miniata TaxID=46514 RepID=A0A913Z9R0_PATMI|nr:forkhead box protein B1-like [Patiria miniata]